MNPPQQVIAENLQRIEARVAAAAERGGRARQAIQLVAVTKYCSPEATALLVAAGCRDLGESRPQSLWSKADWLGQNLPSAGDICWHMIGHLQRNKLKRTLPLIGWLHAGDSLRLLEAVQATAKELALTTRPRVLLEVNISGDRAKHGFAPSELEAALAEMARLDQLDIRGLMGMSGLESSLDQARREFAALRELADRLKPRVPDNVQLTELSMGMSDDFEVAIEEGATMIRVGSALVEGLRE